MVTAIVFIFKIVEEAVCSSLFDKLCN